MWKYKTNANNADIHNSLYCVEALPQIHMRLLNLHCSGLAALIQLELEGMNQWIRYDRHGWLGASKYVVQSVCI